MKPERIILAGGDAPARAKARSSCTSAHGKWLWLEMEVCAHWTDAPAPVRGQVTSSAEVIEICRAFAERYMNLQEFFGVLCLSARMKPVGFAIISVGAMDAAVVDMRVLFKPVLLSNSAAFIATHNHPSGDPSPSPEDMVLTTKMVSAAALLGVRLLDHVIVAEKGHFSFLDSGLLAVGSGRGR
jgi:DNA repair protein RadC